MKICSNPLRAKKWWFTLGKSINTLAAIFFFSFWLSAFSNSFIYPLSYWGNEGQNAPSDTVLNGFQFFPSFWKLNLILWISKHFRSCNNATSLINSGTSSMSSIKQNKGYRINCWDNYLSLSYFSWWCLSLTFTVCQISFAPLIDRNPQVKQNQAMKQEECLAAQCCKTQPSCTAGSAERPAVTLAGLEEARITNSRWVKIL